MQGWRSNVRLITKPDMDGIKKHVKPYQPVILEPDENIILSSQYRLKEEVDAERKELLDDDGDEDFQGVEDNQGMIFSFVRHNRLDAVNQLLEQDASLIRIKDDNGNNLLHIACQNN